MKNFHQNLLITLALSLCGLCAWQWYNQAAQRGRIEELGRHINQDAAEIQTDTNNIHVLEQHISDMDNHITELKATVKSNDQTIIEQKREFNKLDAEAAALTNEVVQYKQAVDTLEGKLKSAYDGVAKQNEAISNLVAQRDEFVQKLNDSVKDRNNIVAKYNELAEQVRKLQTNGGKTEK